MITNITELMDHAKKLNALNKAQIEKVGEGQQLAVKEYVEMTGAQIKAAIEVKDASSFNSFIDDQWACAQGSLEKMIASNKALFEDLKAYNEECIKLWKEGNSMVNKAANETVKKVTKKAV